MQGGWCSILKGNGEPTRVAWRQVVAAAIAMVALCAPAAAEILGPGGKCLDLKDGRVVDGASVVLDICKDSEAQQWTAVDGKMFGPGNLCLDVSGRAGNGARAVVVSVCRIVAEQQWAPSKGRILLLDGTCLQGRDTPDDEAVPVTVAQCSGSGDQRWVVQ